MVRQACSRESLVTATAILETLAREFEASPKHVQRVIEMIDAGLSAPFIGRFRRDDINALHESVIRRIDRRREELEELDRRRGTIKRMLERDGKTTDDVLGPIDKCVDRFELEDLFIPHRRPEPEVQLAVDRGLGELADLLVKAIPRAPKPKPDTDEPKAEEAPAESDSPEAAPAEDAPKVEPPVAEPATEEPVAEEAQTADAVAPTAPEEETSAAPVVEAEAAKPDESQESAVATEAPKAAPDAKPEAKPEADKHVHQDKIELTAQLARLCTPFVSPDKGVHTEAEALNGAMRILADRLGRNAHLRGLVRRILRKHGVLNARAIVDASKAGRFKQLLKLKKPLKQLQGRNLLAIRQAQKERILNTVLTLAPDKALPKVRAVLGKHTPPAHEDVLRSVARQAFDQRLMPMIESEVRLELKERADQEALRFLSQHLRQILLAPPLGALAVAGMDVSAKGDWTFGILDSEGGMQGGEVTFQTGEKDVAALAADIKPAFETSGVRAIAVGHGKNSRAAVPRLREVLAESGLNIAVMIVNEAGLSSYANSEMARKELPDCSIGMRMAVSLGRRLQDPMMEILKVDPRHLGLGSEQGLVSKANVKRVFKETLESCVSHVGCSVHHASAVVLANLPGLDKEAAQKIIERRTEKPFGSREELRESGVLTEAQWTSAIAFMRVPGSTEPLDRTNLHPESYPIARKLLEAAGTTAEDGLGRPGVSKGLRRTDFEVEASTWRDLMRELAQPGRDPRPRLGNPDYLPADTDKVRITKDRVVEGVVSNVTSFGAFVDIGLAADAMIHISEISSHYVRDARELLSIGQNIRAKILDPNGQRISLTLKNVPAPERAPRAPRREQGGRGGERSGAGGGRGGGGGGRKGGRREREERKEDPNLRAAQSRRDGLGGAAPARRAGGRPGGNRDRDRGTSRGKDEGDRTDVKKVASDKEAGKHNPFANFFKKDE